MPGIFISYRREDSAGHAGRLAEALAARFGRELVFLDVDAIAPSAEFPAVLEERVARSDVLLALVGPGWLRATGDHGARRLDDPRDFVRREVASALARGIPVIPVLLGGARMPRAEELPEELRPLAARNAFELPDRLFHQGMRELVTAVGAAMPHVRPRLSRRALVVGAAAGGLAVLSIALRGLASRPDAPTGPTPPPGDPESGPALAVSPPQDVPRVRQRAIPDVARPPAAVAGAATAGALSGYAAGPRSPRVLWVAPITVGHMWRVLGVATDGTVYILDSEYGTLGGVRDGAERWAYSQLREAVGGVAPDGRLWLSKPDYESPPFSTRLYCFNSEGEGGRLHAGARPPRDLAARLAPADRGDDGYSCRDGTLHPSAGGWRHELDGNCATWRPLRGPDGVVYAASDRGTLYALGADGAVRWTYRGAPDVRAPLPVGDDVVIVDRTQVVSLRGGRPRWTLPLRDARPGVADRTATLYVGYGAKPAGSYMDERHLAIVDGEGRMLWRRHLSGCDCGPIGLDPDGRLYVAGSAMLACLGD